jgi:hypothetical protein
MTNAEDDASFKPEELETLDGELLPEREALSVIRSSADTLADAAAAPIPAPDAGSTDGGGYTGTTSGGTEGGAGGGIVAQPVPDAGGADVESDPNAESTKPPAG